MGHPRHNLYPGHPSWHQKVNGNNSPSLSFDAANIPNNNRVIDSGYGYDAVGNVINDGFHAYTYDAENRITQVDGGATATYTYDPFGRRVKNTATGRECLYDLGGNCIVEFSGGTWNRTDLRALGQTIASYSNGTVYFDHSDHLGTTRAQTTITGAVRTTCTYEPFGTTFNCSGSGNASADQFTGYEHDTESGLEHSWFANTALLRDASLRPILMGRAWTSGTPSQ
jgi:YD repeat-containing protein